MAQSRKRFAGVSRKQVVKIAARRDDVRTFRQRLSDLTSTAEGTMLLFGGLAALSFLLSWAPFVPEIIFLIAAGLFWTFYRFSKKRWDLPFRVPAFLNSKDRRQPFPVLDASTDKKGAGNLYLGMDEETGEEVWGSTDDVNKHVLQIGTTGAGKTESFMGHIFGMLALGSGALLVDGKASANTFDSMYRIARLLGRDPDLLTMDYLTGGKDMLGPQTDRRSHTYNALSFGGSAQKSEMFISLLVDSGDIWSDRAVALVEGIMPSLTYLSDQGMVLLNPDLLSHFVVLENLENLAHFGVIRDLHGEVIDLRDRRHAAQWHELRLRLKGLDTYFATLPGGSLAEPKGPWKPDGMSDTAYEVWMDEWFRRQDDVKRPEGPNNGVDQNARQELNRQHGFVVMQFTRSLNNLSSNYGYIYGAEVGEISFTDMVLNRRAMVVLLPALERSETNLEQLGRLTVIALRTILGSLLNTRAEGLRREIIDGNPSNSRIPFVVMLDEVGQYMVKGLAVIPAQARQLGVACYFGTQSISDLMKKSPEEGNAILENTALKFFGRLTGDQESLTAKTAVNMGGRVNVQVADDMRFERSITGTGGRLKLGDHSSLQEHFHVSYSDLAKQENGEVHMVVGTKDIDDKGVRGGGPRVVRMLSFFTGLVPKIPLWRRNPFVQVLPPPSHIVVREREGERGRRFVSERLGIVSQSPRGIEAVRKATVVSLLARRMGEMPMVSSGETQDGEVQAEVGLRLASDMHRGVRFQEETAMIDTAEAGFVTALKEREDDFDAPHALTNLRGLAADTLQWARREKGRRFGGEPGTEASRLARHTVAKVLDSNLDRIVESAELHAAE